MSETIADWGAERLKKRSGEEKEKVKKHKKTHALALQSLAACAIIDSSFLRMR